MPKGRKISVSFVSEPIVSNDPPYTQGEEDDGDEGDDEGDGGCGGATSFGGLSEASGSQGRGRRRQDLVVKVVQQKILRLQVSEVKSSVLCLFKYKGFDG